MKLALATLLFVSLVLSSSFLSTVAQNPQPTPDPCADKCSARCKAAGVQDRCIKYCGICCKKCNCVPSGQYGNKSECPCYRDLKNSKGTSKCP